MQFLFFEIFFLAICVRSVFKMFPRHWERRWVLYRIHGSIYYLLSLLHVFRSLLYFDCHMLMRIKVLHYCCVFVIFFIVSNMFQCYVIWCLKVCDFYLHSGFYFLSVKNNLLNVASHLGTQMGKKIEIDFCFSPCTSHWRSKCEK